MDFGNTTIYVAISLMQVLLESDHFQKNPLCDMESRLLAC